MFTTFRGGQSGAWRITALSAVKGPPLAAVPSLSVVHSEAIALPLLPSQTSWRLAGVASHVRYVERPEKTLLAEKQEGLGRPEASCAALIPIRKSAAWWELTQEERRRIFEDQSHHIAAGLKYLPDDRAAALSLPRSRRALRFSDLVRIRAARHARPLRGSGAACCARTEEWSYVEREVDIRVTRIDLAG